MYWHYIKSLLGCITSGFFLYRKPRNIWIQVLVLKSSSTSKNKLLSTYINKAKDRKNEHRISKVLHFKEPYSGTGGWGKNFHSQDTTPSFGVFQMEPEFWTQGNLYFKGNRKAFYKCSIGSKCKENKLTVVIRVKNDHDFLYEVTSERIKQIS